MNKAGWDVYIFNTLLLCVKSFRMNVF